MNKRGQVTVFVIVGIMMVTVFAATLLLQKQFTTPQLEAQENEVISREQVRLLVQSCVEDLGRDAVLRVSAQGGYYHTPPPYYEFGALNIPYFFDQKVLPMPSRSEVETEIKQYFLDYFDSCLEPLYSLPLAIFVSEEKEVQVEIHDTTLNINLNLDLGIQEGGIRVQSASAPLLQEDFLELNSFSARIPSSLGRALRYQEQMMNIQQENPRAIRMSKLARLAREEQFEINLRRDNNTVFYILQFPPPVPDQDSDTYVFAMKYYNWTLP